MTKSPSASPDFSVRDFFVRFPNELTCLEHIMQVRFGGTKIDCPSCGAVDVHFHKLHERRVYACPECLFQIAPTANTILQDTRTPLVSWYYAMWLFCTTRHGVSAKELQRQLGVTYKTAWRMGQQIRQLIEKADYSLDTMLSGHVELDEAYVGGRVSGMGGGRGAPNKTVVFALAERNGRIRAKVVPNAKTVSLRPIVLENVERGSTISTDELRSYGLLTNDGYRHGTVNHGKKEYARYVCKSVTFHVNTCEGFFRLFKSSVRSTHIHVSGKYMQRYLNEFTFRANHRERVNGMFDLMVGAL
jgi:transposase-like protein